jgi:hypothetical protein
MARSVPSWFAADQVYHGVDGWYVGSADGLHVGPYPDQAGAEISSRGVCLRLRRTRTTREAIGVVRAFLGSQGASLQSSGHDTVRAGEDKRTWHRRRRVFNVNRLWFISTREGIDVGPYESVAEAERDCALIRNLLKASTSEAAGRLAIYEFMNRPLARRRAAAAKTSPRR